MQTFVISIYLLFNIVQSDNSNLFLNRTFKWISLNKSLLENWYRPVDFCLLQINNSEVPFMEYKNKVCKSPDRQMIKHCGPGFDLITTIKFNNISALYLGMAHRSYCPPPLSTREYFFKAVAGYEDPQKMPLLSLLQIIRRSQRSIVFLGDSLMLQKLRAFICETERKGHFTSSLVVKDYNCHLVYSVKDQIQLFPNIHESNSSNHDGVQIHFLRIGKSNDNFLSCPQNKLKLHDSYGTWVYAKKFVSELVQVSPFTTL